MQIRDDKSKGIRRCVALLCAMVLMCTMTIDVLAEEKNSTAVENEGQSELWDGLQPEDTILTVGEEKIPLKKAYFLLKFQQSIVQSMQKATYGPNWYSIPIYEGDRSFQDNMKDSIMNLLVRMSLAKQQMKDLGVSISKAQKQKIDETVEQFFSSNSDEALEAMMADKDTVTEVLTDYTILSQVIAKMTDGVKVQYGEARTYSYVYGQITEGGESVLEDVDEKTETMINDFQSIRKSVLEGKDFDVAAAEKGYPSALHTYFVGDDTDRLTEFNEAMDGAAEGEVSELVYTKGSKGVFLGCRVALDEESLDAAKESVKKNEKAKALHNRMEELIQQQGYVVDENLWAQVTMQRSLAAYNQVSDEMGSEGSGK